MSAAQKTIAHVAGLIFFLSATAFAKPYLYVENTISGDVSVISVPEHEVVSLIPVGSHPDDVIGSADGKTVFVNRGVVKEHSWDVTEIGEIVAISTETDEIKWRLPIHDGVPHHMSISRDGVLYVPLFNQAHILAIDTAVPRIIGRIDGHYGMHGTRLSADEKRIYAGSMMTRAVYVIDIAKNRPTKVIHFKEGVRPFAFTEDESILYAQQSRLHGFEVADLSSGEVIKTVNLPTLPDTLELVDQWPHNTNHGLELSPDEQYLFAAGSVANYIAVYRHPTLELVKTIAVGRDPNWIVFSPDGKYAYVGCQGTNEVSIISTDKMEEIKRLKTGGRGTKRLRIVDVPHRRVD